MLRSLVRFPTGPIDFLRSLSYPPKGVMAIGQQRSREKFFRSSFDCVVDWKDLFV